MINYDNNIWHVLDFLYVVNGAYELILDLIENDW